MNVVYLGSLQIYHLAHHGGAWGSCLFCAGGKKGRAREWKARCVRSKAVNSQAWSWIEARLHSLCSYLLSQKCHHEYIHAHMHTRTHTEPPSLFILKHKVSVCRRCQAMWGRALRGTNLFCGLSVIVQGYGDQDLADPPLRRCRCEDSLFL